MAFTADATRPVYGGWTFGWYDTRPLQPQQAWLTKTGTPPAADDQQLPVPPLTLKPTGFGVEGGYSVTDGSVAEDVYAVNAPIPGSFRLYFDLASLVQGADYTLTFNATGVADNSDTLFVSWCGGAPFAWDTANPNPFSEQFDAPAAYTAEFRYIDISMPSDIAGDFFIHDVSITRV